MFECALKKRKTMTPLHRGRASRVLRGRMLLSRTLVVSIVGETTTSERLSYALLVILMFECALKKRKTMTPLHRGRASRVLRGRMLLSRTLVVSIVGETTTSERLSYALLVILMFECALKKRKTRLELATICLEGRCSTN